MSLTDLLDGFFAGDVEDALAGPREADRGLPQSVDLPMPGSPPASTAEDGTRPPPGARSSSSMPVGARA